MDDLAFAAGSGQIQAMLGGGNPARIPEVDRTIVIVKSDALAQAQVAYAWAVGIAGWLPWVALLLLVAGKADLGNGVVSKESIDNMCTSYSMEFLEVSAKTGQNVDEVRSPG